MLYFTYICYKVVCVLLMCHLLRAFCGVYLDIIFFPAVHHVPPSRRH